MTRRLNKPLTSQAKEKMAMAMAMVNRVRSTETAIVTTTNHSRNRNVRSVLSAKSFTKENASSKTNLILNLIPKQMILKFTVKQYANLMQSMMANATAFTPSKKKKHKVTIAESEDDEENNYQINNEDGEGCVSDDEETRVAMCKILGKMSLSLKKNDRHKATKCTNDNKLDDKLNEKFYLYTSTNHEVSEPPTQKTNKNDKTTEIVVEVRFKDAVLSIYYVRFLIQGHPLLCFFESM
jgi:hypothetical protein